MTQNKQMQPEKTGIIQKLKKRPSRIAVVSFSIIILSVVAVVVWPKTISFAYAGKTCIAQPLLFPWVMKTDSDEFEVKYTDRFMVGNVVVASSGLCVEPLKAPKPGVFNMNVFPAWAPFVKKTFVVVVPTQPIASLRPFEEPIPVAHALKIPLNKRDAVFAYKVSFNGDRIAECENEKKELSCDISDLNLMQGRKYELRLERYFNKERIETIFTQRITILDAIKVLKTSIKNGQTVYSKLKKLDIELDKPIERVSVSLVQSNGGKETLTETEITGKKLTISWAKDLERQKQYKLTLKDMVGEDGSQTERAFSLSFHMSGGPRVASINIGSYGIEPGTTAVLFFDQPLLSLQNAREAISASSGANVTGISGSRAYISFSGVSRCTDSSISVSNGLKSKQGISGGSAWSYLTRTICQKITKIGTSLQGRDINAYWFGAGPKTIVFTGGIHGNEASTYLLMRRWIDTLEANVRLIPAGIRVVVVPLINPDGYYAGKRTNANNVDLNRNFDTSDWQEDVTTVNNKPFPSGGGSSPLSEPESKAIAKLIKQLKPSLVLSYHSTGSLVLANHKGNSTRVASQYARDSGYSYSQSTSGSFDYSVSGTADDYYAEKLAVASVVVELGSDSYHEFERNIDALWGVLGR